MTRPNETAKVHVVGAGLAGLSAAVTLAGRGVQVVLSEAAKQAGGRCRSYHDSVLDRVIDNGNHLVLSGNDAVVRYVRAIGSEECLRGPDRAEFPFFDVSQGLSWTLRPNEGRIPWWILSERRRVPGTRLREYLAIAALLKRHPGRRIDEVIDCRGPLWENFLKPLFVSILNTEPHEASADLAGAVLRETLAKGGRHIRPLVATPTLAAAFVDPAMDRLRQGGANVRLGRSLRAVIIEGDRLAGLVFDDGTVTLGPKDMAIVAVPPWIVEKVLPGVNAPDEFRAIVNAHFLVRPSENVPAITGVTGGTAEWVFAFPNHVSVTVSAADRLVDMETDALAELLWRDVATVCALSGPVPPCRIIKEKRATFAPTPAQERRRPPARTPWKNLFLAGDWTDTGLPATIEGALRSGEVAARLVVSAHR